MPNRMQLHWGSVRGFLQREWPELTDQDLEEIDGEYDRLLQKIREIYGGPDEITQEAALKDKLQRYLNRLEGASPAS